MCIRDRGNVKDRVAQIVDAKPIVFIVGVPVAQLDHQVDLFGVAYRGDTKQILDAQDAEAPNLHVMLEDFAARTDHDIGHPLADLDDIVGYESMLSLIHI